MPLPTEPALKLGAILSAVLLAATAALGIFTDGGFADGVQLPELVAILAPIALALRIRLSVVSPATAERWVQEARLRGIQAERHGSAEH